MWEYREKEAICKSGREFSLETDAANFAISFLW
jgi:hypothetical protein